MENFQIVSSIGSGAFGQVYQARHKLEDKFYVLKKIKTKQMSEQDRQNTKNEVKLLQNLRHSNIVAYQDSFTDNENELNIAMVYCEGGDMYQKIKNAKGKPFPQWQILDWMAQICLALHYLHDQQILHRDIKTQNIFLKNERVRIGDFGIAQVFDSTREFANTSIGTPYYMSPELLKNQPYNYQSDIWSLGCVLYEICNLKHAFDAQNLQALVVKIMKGKFAPISRDYSQNLRDLINRMLHINPKNRPTIWELINKPILKKRIIIYMAEIFSGNYPEKTDVDDICHQSLKEQAEKMGILGLIKQYIDNEGWKMMKFESDYQEDFKALLQKDSQMGSNDGIDQRPNFSAGSKQIDQQNLLDDRNNYKPSSQSKERQVYQPHESKSVITSDTRASVGASKKGSQTPTNSIQTNFSNFSGQSNSIANAINQNPLKQEKRLSERSLSKDKEHQNNQVQSEAILKPNQRSTPISSANKKPNLMERPSSSSNLNGANGTGNIIVQNSINSPLNLKGLVNLDGDNLKFLAEQSKPSSSHNQNGLPAQENLLENLPNRGELRPNSVKNSNNSKISPQTQSQHFHEGSENNKAHLIVDGFKDQREKIIQEKEKIRIQQEQLWEKDCQAIIQDNMEAQKRAKERKNAEFQPSSRGLIFGNLDQSSNEAGERKKSQLTQQDDRRNTELTDDQYDFNSKQRENFDQEYGLAFNNSNLQNIIYKSAPNDAKQSHKEFQIQQDKDMFEEDYEEEDGDYYPADQNKLEISQGEIIREVENEDDDQESRLVNLEDVRRESSVGNGAGIGSSNNSIYNSLLKNQIQSRNQDFDPDQLNVLDDFQDGEDEGDDDMIRESDENSDIYQNYQNQNDNNKADTNFQSKENFNPQFNQIQEKIETMRQRCEHGIGQENFHQLYHFVKDKQSSNMRSQDVRQYIIQNIISEDNIGYWHYVDQIINHQEIIKIFPINSQ